MRTLSGLETARTRQFLLMSHSVQLIIRKEETVDALTTMSNL